MKTETNGLIGPALDWAVAKCGQLKTNLSKGGWLVIDAYENEHLANPYDDGQWQRYSPSTNWAQGGPIIEREGIALEPMTHDKYGDGWLATRVEGPAICMEFGPTMLVAAMRCYVVSRLGEEVEVPEGLV